MKPDHWQKVEQLYRAALEREESQQATFIKESSADDEELRHYNQVTPNRSVNPSPLRFPAGNSTSSSAL